MTTTSPTPATGTRLSRAVVPDRPAAPVRIVHVGVGNFFRAHQAWYTDRAPDASAWGIAAFTGRSPAVADALEPQDGLYTLVTRAADGDTFDVIGSVSAVHRSDDHAAWLGYWSSPDVVIVTLTVTEAGYLRGPDGHLDTGRDDVRADIAALGADPSAPVRTTPGRLVAGLLARRSAGAGALTIVPCDNLPENGPALATVVADLVSAVDPSLAAWVAEHVEFATTMVDRITPATTDEHRAVVLEATGLADAAPVPTEPFSEWVIQGTFAAGRPAWDAAGAHVVDDVEPFEQRKLRLLNGAHTLLAYAGTIRGHETVAEAIGDDVLRGWVEEWWSEASTYLTLPDDDVAAYRAALLDRFGNPAIRHALAQIAADGSQKLPVRILPTLRAELAAGRVPPGATRALGAWVVHLRGTGAPVKDARAEDVHALAGGSLAESVERVLGFLAPDLVANQALREAVLARAEELGG
ncbi:mannitol dehydrogenase family protein [Cellulomonas sp. ATA003]|uniref:mannitol dehydrogenase family protein n=1 Tax=Cellulomonas sp. ATA003 TaxID=3073064 RepID=UPI002872CEBF|nr:mannitol dehydrogenase family protein [Cellulomonas sp. ATA003]WNB87230.1 mannitol dehydrogenase family protein [Cellulomonas sp. ATA003]